MNKQQLAQNILRLTWAGAGYNKKDPFSVYKHIKKVPHAGFYNIGIGYRLLPGVVPSAISTQAAIEELRKSKIPHFQDVAYSMIEEQEKITDEDYKNIKKITSALRKKGYPCFTYLCSRTVRKYLIYRFPFLKDALCRDEKGDIIMEVPYNIPARLAGCFNNPKWIRQLKTEAEIVIKSGIKAIFYDNPVWLKCYCKYCREKFWKYSKKNLGRPYSIPKKMDWTSEVWQCYEMFLCKTLSDAMKNISSFCKSIDPEFTITMNTSPPTLHSPSIGILPSYFVNNSVDWTFYEAGFVARKHPDRVIWNIEHLSYGVAEAEKLGKTLLYMSYEDPAGRKAQDKIGRGECPNINRLNAAEAWAFKSGYWIYIDDYYRFIKNHPEIHAGSKMYGDVGIFFSHNNLLRVLCREHSKKQKEYQNVVFPCYPSEKCVDNFVDPDYKACCELLANLHVPFKTFLDLKDVDTNILIIPNVRYLTKEEKETLDGLKTRGVKIINAGKNSREVKYFLGKDKSYIKEFSRIIKSNLSGNELIKKVVAPKEALITVFKNKNNFIINLVNYNVGLNNRVRDAKNVRIVFNKIIRNAKLISPDKIFCKVKLSGGTELIIPKLHIYGVLIVEISGF